MLDNTVIVFTSDNGAIPSKGFASNYPLRGQKYMVFEGKIIFLNLIFLYIFLYSVLNITFVINTNLLKLW